MSIMYILYHRRERAVHRAVHRAACACLFSVLLYSSSFCHQTIVCYFQTQFPLNKNCPIQPTPLFLLAL